VETVAVAGAELSSMALGDGAGPTVVMLHGLFSGNMATWYSGFAATLARGRRVLLYDQRGHGSSSFAHQGFDLQSQAADLHDVLIHYRQGEAPLDLVGHSMGALIALRFALLYPHRVRRLVLVDAPMPARQYVAPGLQSITAEAFEDPATAQRRNAAGRRKERASLRLRALLFESTLLEDLLSMDAEPDAALATLDMPVLLVYGRGSPCLAAGLHLNQIVPQSHLELLDCGHYIPEEAPEQLRAHIEAFLPVASCPEGAV
jgi:pimeloyl-ACP methyl ester carboxylesterase